MKLNSMFPSKYLRGDDLEKPARVTVASIQMEKMEDGTDKPVVRFEGKERGVVLNKTRARALAQIAGSDDTRDWPGTVLQVQCGQTAFKGEPVTCVEFAKPGNGQKPKQEVQQPIEDDLDDDIPF